MSRKPLDNDKTTMEFVAQAMAAESEGFPWRLAASMVILVTGCVIVVVNELRHGEYTSWLGLGLIGLSATELGVKSIGVYLKKHLGQHHK